MYLNDITIYAWLWDILFYIYNSKWLYEHVHRVYSACEVILGAVPDIINFIH